MPIHYTAPSVQDLRAQQERLKKTGSQMADMYGLAGNNQWRKYTTGKEPRPMGIGMLFVTGALYLGPHATVEQIFDWCRAVGATIEVKYPQEAAGESQP
jgi:hypothetical protein